MSIQAPLALTQQMFATTPSMVLNPVNAPTEIQGLRGELSVAITIRGESQNEGFKNIKQIESACVSTR